MAFSTTLNTPLGVRGIFTGADPVADRVIRTGDPLDGSTVTFLFACSKSLNEAGQIAFFSELADGRQGIFRADPLTAFQGRTEQLGTTNAKLTLERQVTGASLTDLDLGASTVMIASILNEAGIELVAGASLPIILEARPGGDADAATFETPGGARPKIRLNLSHRVRGW